MAIPKATVHLIADDKRSNNSRSEIFILFFMRKYILEIHKYLCRITRAILANLRLDSRSRFTSPRSSIARGIRAKCETPKAGVRDGYGIDRECQARRRQAGRAREGGTGGGRKVESARRLPLGTFLIHRLEDRLGSQRARPSGYAENPAFPASQNIKARLRERDRSPSS